MSEPNEKFPRTMVGGVSLSRMIVGTNWFLGWSHCTKAKDALITDTLDDHRKIADILEVFFRAGVNTVMGLIQHEKMHRAVREAEQRTGVAAIIVSTPALPTNRRTAVDGFDMDEVCKVLDKERELGARFCLPHTSTTDLMVDRCSREVRQMVPVCAAIRERGMIPGLSTHLPETIIFSDETELDVETYIAIYNAMGFLMPLEVDWTMRTIQSARKPVMTIKPMAAGQLRPLQALTFVWNTLRSEDMMTVGTMSPREAHEVVEMSLGILERRAVGLELQETRSKSTVKPQVRGK
jgi:hypothetical protein